MRFVSDIALGLACLSAAFAIFFNLVGYKSESGNARRLGWLAFVGLAALAASHLAGARLSSFQDAPVIAALQVLAIALALAISLAVWWLLPAVSGRPSSLGPVKNNSGFEGEAAQRAAEILRLAEKITVLEAAAAERAHALDESNQRFVNALKDTGVFMAQQDSDLRYLWVHNWPDGLGPKNVIGKLQQDVLPPDSEPLIAEAKRKAMHEKTPVQFDVSLKLGEQTLWLSERIEPVWREGRVVGVLTTAIDMTTHFRQEAELRRLLRELTHRTKNLLAVIMGIARQSSESAQDVATFIAHFDGRIRALSVTHELLVESAWRGTALRKLIECIWRVASPRAAERVAIVGAELFLKPESAQNVALALHEMASHAIEHGGLLESDRKIQISWATTDDSSEAVSLRWEEIGFPASVNEQFDGFGKSFVLGLLPRAVNGRSDIVMTDDGLAWTLNLPARNFVVPEDGNPLR